MQDLTGQSVSSYSDQPGCLHFSSLCIQLMLLIADLLTSAQFWAQRFSSTRASTCHRLLWELPLHWPLQRLDLPGFSQLPVRASLFTCTWASGGLVSSSFFDPFIPLFISLFPSLSHTCERSNSHNKLLVTLILIVTLHPRLNPDWYSLQPRWSYEHYCHEKSHLPVQGE